jgi:hypothetical protein
MHELLKIKNMGALMVDFLYGNVSGVNQPLCATVQTSNLGHMMLIQGGVGESGRGDLQKCD